MIPGESKEDDRDFKDEGDDSEEGHKRPHHSLLVQVENLPDGPEAANEVKHDLKHVDFIE